MALHAGHFGPHHVYNYPTTYMFQVRCLALPAPGPFCWTGNAMRRVEAHAVVRLWRNTLFLLQDKSMYTGNIRGGTKVFNPDGSIAFQTRDAVLTIRNKEVVYDAMNQPMACLHLKSLTMVRNLMRNHQRCAFIVLPCPCTTTMSM